MKRIMAPVNYDYSDFDRTFNYESFSVDTSVKRFNGISIDIEINRFVNCIEQQMPSLFQFTTLCILV